MAGPVAGMNPSQIRDDMDDIGTITQAIIDYLADAKYTIPVGVDSDGNVITEERNLFVPSDVPVNYNMSGYINNVTEPGDPTQYGSMDAMMTILVREITNQVTKQVIDHIKNNLSITIPSNSFVQTVLGGAMAPAVGIPNILPVKCDVDDLVSTVLTGGNIGVDLT